MKKSSLSTGEKYHFTKTPTPDLWTILTSKDEKDKCSSNNIKEVMNCHSAFLWDLWETTMWK